MATQTKPRTPKPAGSLGEVVADWIEVMLVHGPGDSYGKPFRLTGEQRTLLRAMYELSPTGDRRYRRVLLGRPKGYGKTEFAAAVGLAELAGPTAPTAPDIPVAAASWEQADLLFGAARAMVTEGPLRDYLTALDTEILRNDGPGRMYRVAAVAGTNDGGRPTFLLCDELHEWTGSKERVHLVLSNGLAKRTGSWEFGISTAGSDLETLLGRMVLHGRAVEAGAAADESFLFDWREHPDGAVDVSTPEAIRAALELVYEGAGEHVDLDRVAARFAELPEYEARRYYLNTFTATPRQWLPAGAWQACADPTRVVEDGAEIVLGFDGSFARDSTALIGCTTDTKPHLFVIGLWEKPAKTQEWRVPRDDVEATVERAMQRWTVREMAADPPGWHQELATWADRYGQELIIEYATNRSTQMAPAVSKFYTAVVERQLTHDGDPRLARHVSHTVTKESAAGVLIVKDRVDSPRKIDAAVAAVIAHDRATLAAPVGAWVGW